jgi:hypothetical protein
MLEASVSLHSNLEQVRALQTRGDNYERTDGGPEHELQRLIDTEWVMLAHNLPTFLVRDETEKYHSRPYLATTWANIGDVIPEDRSRLQIQVRRTSAAIEIHTRLADCGKRELVSEAERSMIIVQYPASINVKDETAENGYRSIIPENEDDWQKMLTTLEQIKNARFDEILLSSHNPVELREAQAAA